MNSCKHRFLTPDMDGDSPNWRPDDHGRRLWVTCEGCARRLEIRGAFAQAVSGQAEDAPSIQESIVVQMAVYGGKVLVEPDGRVRIEMDKNATPPASAFEEDSALRDWLRNVCEAEV